MDQIVPFQAADVTPSLVLPSLPFFPVLSASDWNRGRSGCQSHHARWHHPAASARFIPPLRGPQVARLGQHHRTVRTTDGAPNSQGRGPAKKCERWICFLDILVGVLLVFFLDDHLPTPNKTRIINNNQLAFPSLIKCFKHYQPLSMSDPSPKTSTLMWCVD